MKKRILFLTGFLLTYLFFTFGPGMAIKLEAPPLEYLQASLRHGWTFKLPVSLVVGGMLTFAGGRGRKRR